MQKSHRHSGPFYLYLLAFLFSLQVALPNFINSSYLHTLMTEKYLGVIYAVVALLTIAGLILMPRALRRIGNFRLTSIFLIIELISLLGLIIYHNLLAVSVFITINIITITFVLFSFDIFLEGFSSDASTGRTRGVYMTVVNLAWFIAPIMTGLILINENFWLVYLASFILLLPVFIILRRKLSSFKDSDYKNIDPLRTISRVWGNKNLLNIFISALLLQIFYSWMTIYVPVYLHINLGFDWKSIGIIFSVMLLPFILLQYPAGKLADSRFGEKEILSIGFLIMATSIMVMFFLTSHSLLLWAAVLFCTRVGAAMVEIMCDVYFFKKVGGEDVNLIGFYRMTRPLAFIIGSLLATLILFSYGGLTRHLFLILSLLLFFGLKFSLSIRDTK